MKNLRESDPLDDKYYRSWHLAKDEFEYRTTEYEWSVIRFSEAFSRFIQATGSAVTKTDLKIGEHTILHVVRMQDRPKTSSMIANLLNRDDVPNIQYSLRKLVSAGLVEKVKSKSDRKQFSYVITQQGIEMTDEYNKIRREVLIGRLKRIENISNKLEDISRYISILTGVYEESARDSAAMTPLY